MKMQAAIVVILLSLCASLALPVPVDRSDQRRDGREISPEELELQLEDIENRISAVRTKVKEEANENKEHLETTKGTPPTSPTEKLAEKTTQVEDHITVGHVKTTNKVQVVVEKETSSPPITTPNPTRKEQTTITKISETPTSVGKTSVVTKVEAEEAGGSEEKSQKEDKEKSKASFVVEKVTKKVEEKEENAEEPEKTKESFIVEKVTEEEEEKEKSEEEPEKAKGSFIVEKVTEVEEKEETDEKPEKIKVTKVANDDTDWNEETDLKSGKQEKSERPTERVDTGKAAATTPVKSEFKVEKITPSPKPSTKSEQSEVVKVEQVPSKQTFETKISKVQRVEEDEDLKEGAASTSSERKGKIEVTVEKESVETSSAKKPPPAKSGEKKIIVKVEKISPSTDETEAKISKVQRVEEDEDLNEGAASTSSDGNGKIEVTVEKELAETSSEKEPPPANSGERKIIVKVEKISPSTDETDAEIEAVERTEKATAKPTKEVPTSKPLVKEVSINVEKITPSQLPTSSKSQSSVVKIDKVNLEDEDLEYSDDKVNSKRSYDAPERSDDSAEEAALELELEGGQEKEPIEKQKEKIDEDKLAEEFDKALKAERNGKAKLKTAEPVKPTSPTEGPETDKPQKVTLVEVQETTDTKGDETEKELDSIAGELEKQNDAPENAGAKKQLSDEELELAELTEERMHDDVKEETKPTGKPTPATPKDEVIKVEKVPKVTVQVTKVNNKRLLSVEETAKEEKKLKDELKSELEQEKEGSPPVITKIEKLGDSPDTKPAAEKARDDPEAKPDSKESASNKEEEKLEADLEGETDTKTKRAASVTGINPEEQLKNMLAM